MEIDINVRIIHMYIMYVISMLNENDSVENKPIIC